MKEINLRDHYPFYNHDTMIEVSDEIALLFREYALLEEAYRIRTLRHKAYYSLEQEDGIERDVLHRPPTPAEILEQKRKSKSDTMSRVCGFTRIRLIHVISIT